MASKLLQQFFYNGFFYNGFLASSAILLHEAWLPSLFSNSSTRSLASKPLQQFFYTKPGFQASSAILHRTTTIRFKTAIFSILVSSAFISVLGWLLQQF
jgi:hypothetical protein